MKTVLCAATALLMLPISAAASCGSAFCLVNTEWASQGLGNEPGVHFDLRYETITLDQPRTGSDAVGVGQVPRHHDEVRTDNRNVVATLDWGLGPSWSVSLALPYVDRDHEHVHNHRAEQITERWAFHELGDARVVARRTLVSGSSGDALQQSGIVFGLKLPTGKHDVTNDEGEAAERTLQPGTGTTDAIVGAWLHSAGASGWSWFVRAEAREALNEREGYRPGPVLQVDGGLRRAIGNDVALMLQANAIVKGQDKGSAAEPDDSGQRAVFVSPGVSWRPTTGWHVYAFVQVPVYQWVRGVQLTADWSAVAGVGTSF